MSGSARRVFVGCERLPIVAFADELADSSTPGVDALIALPGSVGLKIAAAEASRAPQASGAAPLEG